MSSITGPERGRSKNVSQRGFEPRSSRIASKPQRDDLTTNRQGPKDEALEKTMTTSQANLGESRKKKEFVLRGGRIESTSALHNFVRKI